MKKKKQQDKKPAQEPETVWLPLSKLTSVAAHIDQGVALTEKQHLNITKRLQIFDDTLLARIKEACGDQLKQVLLYSEQIERWKREELTDQHFELTRLEKQCQHMKVLVTEILERTANKEHQTIETIMDMDDAELALRFLAGEISHD